MAVAAVETKIYSSIIAAEQQIPNTKTTVVDKELLIKTIKNFRLLTETINKLKIPLFKNINHLFNDRYGYTMELTGSLIALNKHLKDNFLEGKFKDLLTPIKVNRKKVDLRKELSSIVNTNNKELNEMVENIKTIVKDPRLVSRVRDKKMFSDINSLIKSINNQDFNIVKIILNSTKEEMFGYIDRNWDSINDSYKTLEKAFKKIDKMNNNDRLVRAVLSMKNDFENLKKQKTAKNKKKEIELFENRLNAVDIEKEVLLAINKRTNDITNKINYYTELRKASTKGEMARVAKETLEKIYPKRGFMQSAFEKKAKRIDLASTFESMRVSDSLKNIKKIRKDDKKTMKELMKDNIELAKEIIINPFRLKEDSKRLFLRVIKINQEKRRKNLGAPNRMKEDLKKFEETLRKSKL